MADNMNFFDKSLEEIIKHKQIHKPKPKGGLRRKNNRKFGGVQKGRDAGGITHPQHKKQTVQDLRTKISKEVQTKVVKDLRTKITDPSGTQQISRIMVTNLHPGVTDIEVRELFSSVGQLKRSSVHYDSSGKSLGTADVTFRNSVDAVKAVKMYNGVPLDGKPMKIEMVNASPLQQQKLVSGSTVRSNNKPKNVRRKIQISAKPKLAEPRWKKMNGREIYTM